MITLLLPHTDCPHAACGQASLPTARTPLPNAPETSAHDLQKQQPRHRNRGTRRPPGRQEPILALAATCLGLKHAVFRPAAPQGA
ncbi:hypothetical protein [Roseovarius confluentis]|uniref:hypothetical protein n=1 Tax=Roseovarius confluentis TaxID=1852027 RepID=UPI003C7EA848